MARGNSNGGSENRSGQRAEEVSFLLDEPLSPEEMEENTRISRIVCNLFDTLGQVPSVSWANHEETASQPSRSVDRLLKELGFSLEGANADAVNRASVTCAIFGSWGSGKTSILRMLQKIYADTGSTTVWFEPWRYENEEHLLVPLLVEMSAKLEQQQAQASLEQAVVETGKRVTTKFLKSLAKTGGKAIERKLGLDEGDVVETFSAAHTDASVDWGQSLSEVENFRQDLHDLVRLAAGAAQTNQKGEQVKYPVAIFIDDLDRCDPEKVRTLIESIKIFLTVPGCIFFTALDEEQVQQALSQPYRAYFPKTEGFNLDATVYGRRYLEKFFQHGVHLNDRYQPYRGTLLRLRRGLKRQLASNISENGSTYKRWLWKIFYSVELNPRSLKKCARWLYFENGVLRPDELVQLFAETVFSVNFQRVWVAELQNKTEEGRMDFFATCSVLLLQRAEDKESMVFDQDKLDLLIGYEEDSNEYNGEIKTLKQSYPYFLGTLTDLHIRNEEENLKALATLIQCAAGRFE